jgi:hypothetical protein
MATVPAGPGARPGADGISGGGESVRADTVRVALAWARRFCPGPAGCDRNPSRLGSGPQAFFYPSRGGGDEAGWRTGRTRRRAGPVRGPAGPGFLRTFSSLTESFGCPRSGLGPGGPARRGQPSSEAPWWPAPAGRNLGPGLHSGGIGRPPPTFKFSASRHGLAECTAGNVTLNSNLNARPSFRVTLPLRRLRRDSESHQVCPPAQQRGVIICGAPKRATKSWAPNKIFFLSALSPIRVALRPIQSTVRRNILKCSGTNININSF